MYRFQSATLSSASDRVLLSNLKWPIETIFAGVRPAFNIVNPTLSGIGASSGNLNAWRDWHRLTRLNDRYIDQSAKAGSLLPTGNADPTALTITAIAGAEANGGTRQTSQIQSRRLTYVQSTKTLTTVQIQAHGIDIFQSTNAEFFSDYMPYHYGGYNVTTPEDEGAMMVNFCLYPGTYQPSGHINVSRAREFYFIFTSAFLGVTDSAALGFTTVVASGTLLVLAIALNFELRELGGLIHIVGSLIGSCLIFAFGQVLRQTVKLSSELCLQQQLT